jgi:hypothetical protein
MTWRGTTIGSPFATTLLGDFTNSVGTSGSGRPVSAAWSR